MTVAADPSATADTTSPLDVATANVTAPAERPALGRRFCVVLGGELLSAVGSALSSVGVAVGLYLRTGSAAWLGAFGALPGLAALAVVPLTGRLDRAGRRSALLATNLAAAACSALALVAVAVGNGSPALLLAPVFATAWCAAAIAPVSAAAVPDLVPPAGVSRGNGLLQLAPACGIVLGPLVAVPLVTRVGLWSVFAADLASFVVAAATSVAVPSMRRPAATDAGLAALTAPAALSATTAAEASRSGVVDVLRWMMREQRALGMLAATMAATNFVLAFFNVALDVVTIESAGARRAGLVFAAAGAAMVLASLVVGARGLPSHRRGGLLPRLLLVFAVGVMACAVRPFVWLVIVGVAVAVATVPASSSLVATVYHERVPPERQARVFGVRFALGQSLGAVGFVVAGIAVRGAERWMSAGGRSAAGVGRLLGGRGPGRGAAAVLVAVSLAVAVLAASLGRSDVLADIDDPAAAFGGAG